MLFSLQDLFGMTVRATDDDAGSVHDVYLDRREWRARYLAVATGPWLLGRRVLISPEAAEAPRWDEKVVPVSLTRDQVRESPDVDLDRPVSRQDLENVNAYYGWPAFWLGGPATGSTPTTGYPIAVAPMDAANRPDAQREPEPFEEASRERDPDLHSAREVMGYRLRAADDHVGTVDDMLLDDSWAIRYLVVDTGGILPGKRVLIAPEWVKDIVEGEREVTVEISASIVRASPEYDPDEPFEREDERRLYAHYGKPGYWEHAPASMPERERS